MSRALRLGSESFWEMVALSMSGRLASCTSCVEHFYFQSEQNSQLFLEACSEAGLLQRISLLDLFGSFGAAGSRRDARYDEPIYLSAPEFRKANPSEARRRIDKTREAVYTALRLYYEELSANDTAIAAAYSSAVDSGLLRYSETAKERRAADLSSLAKLRLIQDGFRHLLREQMKESDEVLDKESVEERIGITTVEYVRGFFGAEEAGGERSDFGSELDRFLLEFLHDEHSIEDYWRADFGCLPVSYKEKWMPAVAALARRRFEALSESAGEQEADSFAENFEATLSAALSRQKSESIKSSMISVLESWRIDPQQPDFDAQVLTGSDTSRMPAFAS